MLLGLIAKHMESEGGTLISPMTLMEIGDLHAAGHLELTIPADEWLALLSEVRTIHVAPIDHQTAHEAANLPSPAPVNPIDRLVVALARTRDLPLVTNNRDVIGSPYVKTIWG